MGRGFSMSFSPFTLARFDDRLAANHVLQDEVGEELGEAIPAFLSARGTGMRE